MATFRRVARETDPVLIAAVQNKVCPKILCSILYSVDLVVVLNIYTVHSQYGWTVVHFAAYNGHLEMLQELLERFSCETDKRDKKVFRKDVI